LQQEGRKALVKEGKKEREGPDSKGGGPDDALHAPGRQRKKPVVARLKKTGSGGGKRKDVHRKRGGGIPTECPQPIAADWKKLNLTLQKVFRGRKKKKKEGFMKKEAAEYRCLGKKKT